MSANLPDETSRMALPGGRPARARRGSTLGWMPALLALVIALILVMVALLLPPFSLGAQFAPLFGAAFSRGTVALEGLLAESTDGLRIDRLERDAFLGAPGPTDSAIRSARRALRPGLNLQSAVYRLETPAGAAGSVRLTFDVPDDATRIDLYGYWAASNTWRFVPARREGETLVAETTPPDVIGLFRREGIVPVIAVTVAPGQALSAEAAALADVVQPSGLRPVENGALDGALPAGIQFGQGYAVVPVVRSETPANAPNTALAEWLARPEFRAAHVEQLVAFAQSEPYSGLAVDYRALPAEARADFTAFVEALGTTLHAAGLSLTVALPYPDLTNGDTGAYDWPALDRAADVLQAFVPDDPAFFAADYARWAQWATEQVSRAHVQIVLRPAHGETRESLFAPMKTAEIAGFFGAPIRDPGGIIPVGTTVEIAFEGVIAPETGFDAASGTPFVRDGGRLLWLMTPGALQTRLARLAQAGFGGVALLEAESAGLVTAQWDALDVYRATGSGQIVVVSGPPVVRWTVATGDRTLFVQEGGFVFQYTPDGSADRLIVRVELPDLGLLLGESEVQVALP